MFFATSHEPRCSHEYTSCTLPFTTKDGCRVCCNKTDEIVGNTDALLQPHCMARVEAIVCSMPSSTAQLNTPSRVLASQRALGTGPWHCQPHIVTSSTICANAPRYCCSCCCCCCCVMLLLLLLLLLMLMLYLEAGPSSTCAIIQPCPTLLSNMMYSTGPQHL